MPTWLEILLAIAGTLVSIAGALGISAYFIERFKHKAARKNRREDKQEEKQEEKAQETEQLLEEATKQRYMEELKKVVSDIIKTELQTTIKAVIAEELKPYQKAVEKFTEDISDIKEGLQCVCCNDLNDMADKSEVQGYISKYNKDRFEKTYKSYHKLGANGVMDVTHDKVINLPEHPPRKRTYNRKIDRKEN